MSQYIKYILSRKDDNETNLEKYFFIMRLEKNREEFAKRLNLNPNDADEAEKLEDKVSMELFAKELIENDKDIIGDRSYNMADHYQFRHLIYFEYFSAFIKKKSENSQINYKVNMNDNFNKQIDDKIFKNENDI